MDKTVREELWRWRVTYIRYSKMLQLLKDIRESFSSKGSEKLGISNCSFCESYYPDNCDKCGWGKEFGICVKSGGEGDPTYWAMRSYVNLSISEMEKLVERITKNMYRSEEEAKKNIITVDDLNNVLTYVKDSEMLFDDMDAQFYIKDMTAEQRKQWLVKCLEQSIKLIQQSGWRGDEV